MWDDDKTELFYDRNEQVAIKSMCQQYYGNPRTLGKKSGFLGRHEHGYGNTYN